MRERESKGDEEGGYREGGEEGKEGDGRGKRSKLDCQKSSQAAEEVMIVSRADK